MERDISGVASKLLRASSIFAVLAMTCWAQQNPGTPPSDTAMTTSAKKLSESNKDVRPQAQPIATGANAVVSDTDFIIGAGDVLGINVWREPEMSRSVPVRPDGKISLPLLGEFQASGLTPTQLQAKLAKQLATLVTNPEVTVIVEQIKSQKFNIMGEVAHPGEFPLTKPMTVLDAVSIAGGLKDFAKAKKMYVLRRSQDGTTVRIPVNYKNAIRGSAKENFEIQERDTIVVP